MALRRGCALPGFCFGIVSRRLGHFDPLDIMTSPSKPRHVRGFLYERSMSRSCCAESLQRFAPHPLETAPAASSGTCVMTFACRVDRWTDDGNSILDYVAAVADFAVARAAYRAACRRWPEAKITLRQGARVVERNWSTSEAAN